MYTITLADGTVLNNLELNGNNYVSKTAIAESTLSKKNLKHIVINDGTKSVDEYDKVLIQLAQYDDEYHFILANKDPMDGKFEDIESKIDYIAMMAEVEL